MSRTYQGAAPDSRERRNRPLFEYSMPLSEEQCKHLPGWGGVELLERNFIEGEQT